MPADGDCFYTAMAQALEALGSPLLTEDESEVTVRVLRERVSARVEVDTVDIFKIAYDAGIAGFEFMRRCRDLETVRRRMAKTSQDVCAGYVVWANDFEIRTMATLARCAILIWDLEAQFNCFLYVEPEHLGQRVEPLRYVMLQRTKRQHYNLITHESRLIDDWPPPCAIAKLWNIQDNYNIPKVSQLSQPREKITKIDDDRRNGQRERDLPEEEENSREQPQTNKDISHEVTDTKRKQRGDDAQQQQRQRPCDLSKKPLTTQHPEKEVQQQQQQQQQRVSLRLQRLQRKQQLPPPENNKSLPTRASKRLRGASSSHS